MVTIIAAHLRENEKGSFTILELQDKVELIQSQNTGRWYATAKRCFVSSTFDQEKANNLVGSTFPGCIIRVQCDPYSFTIGETGEEVQLTHRWEYTPEDGIASKTSMISQLKE
jgi:hypothetical protein